MKKATFKKPLPKGSTPDSAFKKQQLIFAAKLRNRGLCNADISKKTGLSLCTIRAWLGKQPEFMTKRSLSSSQKRAWARRKQREQMELVPLILKGVSANALFAATELKEKVTPSQRRMEKKLNKLQDDSNKN